MSRSPNSPTRFCQPALVPSGSRCDFVASPCGYTTIASGHSSWKCMLRWTLAARPPWPWNARINGDLMGESAVDFAGRCTIASRSTPSMVQVRVRPSARAIEAAAKAINMLRTKRMERMRFMVGSDERSVSRPIAAENRASRKFAVPRWSCRCKEQPPCCTRNSPPRSSAPSCSPAPSRSRRRDRVDRRPQRECPWISRRISRRILRKTPCSSRSRRRSPRTPSSSSRSRSAWANGARISARCSKTSARKCAVALVGPVVLADLAASAHHPRSAQRTRRNSRRRSIRSTRRS